MELKEKMREFNKRWSIVSTDSCEEALDKFKNRILNIFVNIDKRVTRESIGVFCQYYGIEEVWHYEFKIPRSVNIIDRLKIEEDEMEFYRLIQLIFSLDITQGIDAIQGKFYSKGVLFEKVKQAIELSDINASIGISKDQEIILYPRGEKKLDNELVDNVLSFLNNKANKHFQEALSFYQSKKGVKSAEGIRRSLEEFLRFKLNNKKGLKRNIKEVTEIAKKDKKDVNVRNIIFQTFDYLDKYFNDESKHNDGDINDAENEYLIYQSALLMRYLNRVLNVV